MPAIIVTREQLKEVEGVITKRLEKLGVHEDLKGSKLADTNFRNIAIRNDVKKLAPIFIYKKVEAYDYYMYYTLHHYATFRHDLELWRYYGIIKLSHPLPSYKMAKLLHNIVIELGED